MLREEDFHFGQRALQENFITKEQLEECILILQTQREAGVEKNLDEVIIENHLMNKDQLMQIYRLLGKNRLGRYEILQKMGQGGTSSVYRASNVETQEVVALKVLLPQLAQREDFMARFLREAQALIQFDHPHIVKAYEVGQSQQYHFLALELLEGTALDGFLAAQDRLEEKFALEIAFQIAKALQYLHDHNFIHRDIKPQNIMISQQGVVKLLDLGLTRQITDVSVTSDGSILGTPFYISPEQIRGIQEDIDHSTDIYSWGATLFHLLTGRPPFLGDGPSEVMEKHLRSPVLAPHKIIRSLSMATSDLIVSTLEKDKALRPASFEVIIKKLNQLLRPDLNAPDEPDQGGDYSEVNQDLIYSPDSRKDLVRDLSENKTSPVEKLVQFFVRIKEEMTHTRWDLVLFLLLLVLVGGGGFFLYKMSSNVSPEVDSRSYLARIKKNIEHWELKKAHRVLADLFRKGQKRVLEEDLEEIFLLLKKNFDQLKTAILKKYQGLADLKRMKVHEVIDLYEYLQTFEKPGLTQKCKKEIQGVQEAMEKVEKKQEKVYFAKLDQLLSSRNYLKAQEWFQINVKSLLTGSIKKRILRSRRAIQFFVKIRQKIFRAVEQSVEKKKGLMEIYTLENQFQEIQIFEWKKKKLTYLTKRIVPFRLDSQGRPRMKAPLHIYKGAPTITVDQFLKKLHLLSLIELCHWQKNYGAILRFLLREKRNYQRDLLIQTYLKLAKKSPQNLDYQILQKADNVIQSRLEYASKNIFKDLERAFWKGQIKKSKGQMKLLTEKFAGSLWIEDHQKSIQAFYLYVKVIEKMGKKLWKESLDLLQKAEKKYGISLFLKGAVKKRRLLSLFIRGKVAKINWDYTRGAALFDQLLKNPSLPQAFPFLLWQGGADWAICHGAGAGKLSARQKGKLIALLHKNTSAHLSLVQREVEGLDFFARLYFRLARSSLKELTPLLKQGQSFAKLYGKAKFYPYLREEIQRMLIFGRGRIQCLEGHFQKGQSLLKTLVANHQKSDFYRAHKKLIHFIIQIHGKVFPLAKDRVKLIYTFANEKEQQDWETRGWGPLSGRFSFLLANEDDFQQNPMGLLRTRLNLFQRLDQWKIFFYGQKNYGFLVHFSQENFLFFQMEKGLYFHKGISIDNYLEKRKKNLLVMLSREKLLSSSGEKQMVFSFQFYPVFSLSIQGEEETYQKKESIPLPLTNLYFWLTTGSGIERIELIGTIK